MEKNGLAQPIQVGSTGSAGKGMKLHDAVGRVVDEEGGKDGRGLDGEDESRWYETFSNAVWKEVITWGRALHNRGLYGDE